MIDSLDVDHSDTSESWASVAHVCRREQISLFSECVLEKASGKFTLPWLVAGVWWEDLTGCLELAKTNIREKTGKIHQLINKKIISLNILYLYGGHEKAVVLRYKINKNFCPYLPKKQQMMWCRLTPPKHELMTLCSLCPDWWWVHLVLKFHSSDRTSLPKPTGWWARPKPVQLYTPGGKLTNNTKNSL